MLRLKAGRMSRGAPGGGDEVQLEAKGVDKEHPSFPIIKMASVPESSPPGAGHT